ncbi:MAG: hypothetical protein HLUCCO02_07015 [Idiomarinaceae bacterium HL-53]|nr:MAG: hypothetical protein HLUCCO02_07015 [Idiomarinaceae bacterium HL-53]
MNTDVIFFIVVATYPAKPGTGVPGEYFSKIMSDCAEKRKL